MEKEKYLFLDCDGVLNCENSLCVRSYDQQSVYIADMRKVDLLKKIIEDTKCKIVVSSVWRLGKERKNVFEYFGIPIHSYTKHIGRERGYEVMNWLIENVDTPYHYAIVDDDSDFLLNQLPFFFQTDPLHGLTSTIAYRITHHLNAGKHRFT